MKLLVIVLCLLSERFLIHMSSHHRFEWFGAYATGLFNKLPEKGFRSNPWVCLAYLILPPVIVSSLLFFFLNNVAFGFASLILNILFFYYCLGPNNPFYPKRRYSNQEVTEEEVGAYLADVNGQLFAVIFWYILTGPIGVLLYRLISLSRSIKVSEPVATLLTAILDWLPAKMTSLLYLLAGNFQAGLNQFVKYFFTPPEANRLMLMNCGLQAVEKEQESQMLLPQAETLVEHALVVLLVFLALFTMVAWL
ncbi:hypothetical protein [Legionella impletisoli]|uniref:Membrane protein n=1 Tax=Legionella impletisoli TaxID=343510 RepID=A0A917JRE8_9GAMM|nr:hypothetical protein [Legionella impletisoli]GGI77949.1 membrane protein [Legionella impletisoli]